MPGAVASPLRLVCNTLDLLHNAPDLLANTFNLLANTFDLLHNTPGLSATRTGLLATKHDQTNKTGTKARLRLNRPAARADHHQRKGATPTPTHTHTLCAAPERPISMPLIPTNKAAAISFFQSHLAAWQSDPAAIGLTAQQVADLAAATDAAGASLLAMHEAHNAAQSATAANDADIAAMRALGSGLIATIRAFARASNDPGVYADADIPAPRPRTPAPTPDAPTHVRGSINNRGAVELRWKGTLALHAFFEVYRKFEDQHEWTLLASVGAKAFTDETIPPGSTSAVSYFVLARRGEHRGEPSDPITVRMGVVPIDTNTPTAQPGSGLLAA